MLTAEVVFSGTSEQKKLATAVLDVLTAYGRFMSVDSSIKVTTDSVLSYLNREGGTLSADKLASALRANSAIFELETIDDASYVATTRTGVAPRDPHVDMVHTFAARFETPLPKPELPPQPVRVRPRVDPSWATFDPSKAIGIDEDDFDLDELPLEEIEAAVAIDVERLVEEILMPTGAIEAELVEAEPELVGTSRVFRGAPVTPTQFNEVEDIELANLIGDRLRNDPRVANFGDQWMLEDRVPRFSRGDLRRLREYIQEQEQPLTDDTLVQDVLQTRPGTSEFDLVRFAVNFRLSKEHREFEFVGTPSQRFWSTSNLPQIGTTRRKPNEIGTDYKYLVDEVGVVAPRSISSYDHLLTFYEHYLGLLPLNAEMQALLPAQVHPSQKSAVLTFDCPQTFIAYLVEVRYPTPNRGGFVLGLDDFYNEKLVPGAMITLDATENDGHYIVKYATAPAQSARLLELEDRRQRYVFRPTSFECGVMEDYLISEERFPNFANEKPLEEKLRRRAESVVAATFERLGHKSDGPGFVADFDELLAAVNIERPFSDTYLRSILENDETGAFARDPDGTDAYTYVPGTSS